MAQKKTSFDKLGALNDELNSLQREKGDLERSPGQDVEKLERLEEQIREARRKIGNLHIT